MAYIDKETSKKIRAALKKAFPEIKFSVRIAHHSKLYVTVLKSPYFDDGAEVSINHHWIERHYENEPEKRDVLNRINEVIKTEGDWFDKSDSMTDYFHTAFYYSIEIGAWDKPHVKV